MLYIAPFSGGSQEIVNVLDNANPEFKLSAHLREFWDALKDNGIVPQTVLGIYKERRDVCLTPVSPVELSVMKLLSDPYFVIGDKLGSNGAHPYKSYGLYNFGRQSEGWNDDINGMSVARLLLETCGDVWEADNAKSRIETTREYIGICVDDTDFQSTYLRFNISDYSSVQRMYMKFKMLNMVAYSSQRISVHSDND